MKNVSESFKEKIKKPFRRFSIRLSIGGTNYDENHIETFKIQSSIGNSDMISLGAFVADNLQLSLINNENYNFPEGAPITIFVALEGEQELCLGKFYVQSDSVEKTKMVTKVDAFGIAGKLAETEYTTNLTFPTSILNMINELETKYNLEFVNKDVLPNIQYKSKPAGTVRAMISEIAQLCCSNVRERFEKLNVHQLEFVFSSDTNEILTADNYFTFKRLSDTPIAFTKLYVEKNDVAIVDGEELKADDLAYGTDDGYCIKITNEHIENEAELKAMYNKNFPYAFIPFECEMQGMPHLEVGDLIIVDELVNQKIFTGYTQKYEVGFNAVSDVDSVIFNDTALPDELTMNETTYVPEVITDVTEQPLQLHIISHALEYNGGFKSTFRSECPDESMLSVGSNGVRMEDIIKRTEKYISMWKVENDRILGMVAKLNGDITEMATKYEQTADEIRLVAERLGEDNAQLKAQLSVMADQITLKVAEIRNEVEVKVSEILQTIDNISLKVAEIDGVKEKVGQIEITSESIRQSVEMLENDVQTGISEINQTVDSITHTVTALENGQETFQTQIEQTVDSITQTITKMEQDTETAFSQIRQEIDSINLEIGAVDKVTGESIVSLINLEPDNIKIESKNIDISGLVTFKDLEGNTETKINGNAIETGTINVLQSTPDSNSQLIITDSGIRIDSDESGDFLVINGQNTGLRIWSGIWATVIQGVLGNDPNSGGIAIGAHDNYGMIKCYPRNYGQANRAGKVEIAAPVIFNGKIYHSSTGNVTDDDGYVTKAELMEELGKWEPEGGGDAGGSQGEKWTPVNIAELDENKSDGTFVYNIPSGTGYATVNRIAEGVTLSGTVVLPNYVKYQGTLYMVIYLPSYTIYTGQSFNTFVINNHVQILNNFVGVDLQRIEMYSSAECCLKIIEDGAFKRGSNSKDSNLTYIEIPDSVKEIGRTSNSYGAFEGCPKLKTVVINPTSMLIKLGSKAFKGCIELENIYIPEGVTSILSYTFEGCENLKKVSFEGATDIGNYAFKNCRRLEQIIAPKVTKIYSYAFVGCESIRNESFLNFPELKQLGTYALAGMVGLESYNNPSITSVSNNAFQGCTALKRVELNSIEYLYPMFQGCVGLEYVSFGKVTKTSSYEHFSGCVNLNYVSMPLLSDIPNNFFENCTALTISGLNMPALTRVGERAFQGCTGLNNIPQTLTSITTHSFANCLGLVNLSSDALTTITGSYAFENSVNIRTVNFPACSNYGSYAFKDLQHLNSVNFGSGNYSGYIYINPSAFENCTALTSLDFSNCKVVTLYTRAFADCINLTRFRFGQSKPSINAAAFTGVTGCTFVFQKKSHYTSLSATSKSSFRYWIEKGEGMSNTVDWIEEDV